MRIAGGWLQPGQRLHPGPLTTTAADRVQGLADSVLKSSRVHMLRLAHRSSAPARPYRLHDRRIMSPVWCQVPQGGSAGQSPRRLDCKEHYGRAFS
jgi:hypothetical protein